MTSKQEIIEYCHELADEFGWEFAEDEMSYAPSMGAHVWFYYDTNSPSDTGASWWLDVFETAFPYDGIDVSVRRDEVQVTINF
jgi:hypothetical protein